MKLRIERLSGPEAWADIAAEWESLDAQSFPRTPFSSPLWISLWWHHLRRQRLLLRDEFFCHIVRDADGRLVAVAPLMLTRIPGFGPLGIRVVQFFGADPAITEIRGVICRRDDHTAVIQALVDHFRQRRDEWDVFKWMGLRHGASEYNTLIIGGEFVADTELPDYLLTLPDSWEKLQSSLSTNMRRKLRIVYKYLERDGHSFVFRVVERPEDVPAAIERFFKLHTARAEATNMINHPNKFATPRDRDFLIDYAHHMAKRGQLRLFELEIDGTVRASRLAFMFGFEIYLFFSGYDLSWKKYSIMTLLVSETIKWAFGQGLQLVNLSTGNDRSKLRWKPSEIIFRKAVQISPTARGQFLFPIYEALARRSRRRIEAPAAAE